MRALFSFLFVGLISSISFAQTAPVQFQNGNNIYIEEISGTVTYFCRDQMNSSYTRVWQCNSDLVSPGTHDYVTSATPIDADTVTLTSTHPDGKTKTKSVGFNAKKSISKSRFNLLIGTLTQSPLLALGTNNVAYSFTKGKNVVNQGSFTSQVTITSSKECRPKSTFTSNENHCIHKNMGCDYYFYMENNCQY